MKHKNFRDFKIVRNCTKKYVTYESYKPHLKRDFQQRCAYCNLKDTSITTPYEIDHFIPNKTFKNLREELNTNYDNLMYSCKKCNDAKGGQFQGNIENLKIENQLFYNPVEVDYNEMFFRNEFGAIDSDDLKGRDMIQKLKLYRPIHSLAWLCEELSNTIDKINKKIVSTSDLNQKEILGQALSKISEYYIECNKVFLANYNNIKFQL